MLWNFMETCNVFLKTEDCWVGFLNRYFERVALLVAFFGVCLGQAATADLFPNPHVTIMYLDLRLAHGDEQRQAELAQYIEQHAVGQRVRLETITHPRPLNTTVTAIKSPPGKEMIANWLSNNARRANANRRVYLVNLNKRFHDYLRELEDEPDIIASTEPRANIHFVAAKTEIAIPGKYVSMDTHEVSEYCMVQSIASNDAAAEIDRWGIKAIGHMPGGAIPNGNVGRAYAAMISQNNPAGSGPVREFLGFGDMTCPDVPPVKPPFQALNTSGPCSAAPAQPASAPFNCAASATTPITPPHKPPRTTPIVQTSPPVSPATGPATVPSQPQGKTFLKSVSDLAIRQGNATVTLVTTEPFGKSKKGETPAAITFASNNIQAKLGLGSGGIGNTVTRLDIQRKQGVAPLELTLEKGATCRAGRAFSARITWIRRGLILSTRIQGYLASCDGDTPTILRLDDNLKSIPRGAGLTFGGASYPDFDDMVILLDASGSMNKNRIKSGLLYWNVAKETSEQLLTGLAALPNENFALVHFGANQQGVGTCNTDLEFGLGAANTTITDAAIARINQLNANGNTSLAEGLEYSWRELEDTGGVIAVITDLKEHTCPGDPCETVRSLRAEREKQMAADPSLREIRVKYVVSVGLLGLINIEEFARCAGAEVLTADDVLKVGPATERILHDMKPAPSGALDLDVELNNTTTGTLTAPQVNAEYTGSGTPNPLDPQRLVGLKTQAVDVKVGAFRSSDLSESAVLVKDGFKTEVRAIFTPPRFDLKLPPHIGQPDAKWEIKETVSGVSHYFVGARVVTYLPPGDYEIQAWSGETYVKNTATADWNAVIDMLIQP
ncbi:vWA domain-containing protein [Candidatus Rhodobacter oscarellae]|nr:vWA domain-containing protein [Candidatus Rhodobacter lobularis]